MRPTRLCFSLAAMSLSLCAATAQSPVAVTHYELAVDVRDEVLIVRASLHLRANRMPKRLELDLAPSMKVVTAKSGGVKIPFDRKAEGSYGAGLGLDLSPLAGRRTADIEIEARGRPHNKFPANRGGYSRTTVSPKITYIRSQYPWYPRLTDDPATYLVQIVAKMGWLVRTAGDRIEHSVREGRATWLYSAHRPTRSIGLVAGPYESVEKKVGKFVLDALVLPGHEEQAETLLGVAHRSFQFYSKQYGRVTGTRFTLVEMPEEFGAGSGYGETGYVLIGAGAFQAAGAASWAASLVAHEVSHTWWGREVHFKHFASESLACYATMKFLEADSGAEAGREERRAAVDRIVNASRAGKVTRSLGEVKAWGRGMDPLEYRVLAYDKGMMILAMLEKAIGARKVRSMLADLFRRDRGKSIDYAVLSSLIERHGKDRFEPAAWEQPELLRLRIETRTAEGPKGLVLRGALIQDGLTRDGSPRPIDLSVDVAVVCGAKVLRKTVQMRGATEPFELRVPAEPTEILIDPDYYVIAARPGPKSDPKAAITKLIRDVVSNPKLHDAALMRRTIEELEGLVDRAPKNYVGVCYTGIGRCRFRLTEFAAAREAFAKALNHGAGGPFHRAWIYLRLGNMADVEKKREEAMRHYGQGAKQGNYFQSRQAKKFMTQPYAGYAAEVGKRP